ncbi:hypothetical protein CIK05_09125 [Bdellovibrio sp. qaytius]|nr:hypothetical protein CIK05_09125 [Bdellovibrio sp. qaytius]
MATSTASSEVFRWPKLCVNQTVSIENKSSKDQTVWLQEWEKTIVDETDHVVPAKSKIFLQLSHDPSISQQDYSLLALDNPKELAIETHCNLRDIVAGDSLEGGVVYYKINPNAVNEVQLKNLFPGRNTFYIEDLSATQKAAPLEIDVEGRDLFKFTLKPEPTSTWVKITARERFRSSVNTSSTVLKPAYTEPQRSIASTEDTYFLMGASDNTGDQFIVKIKDPAMVQKARDQITNPKLQKIVFAKIALGSQGYNRNMTKKEKSFWSWSVTEVTNISDFGSTACNGFPQMLEDQAETWVNGLGKICFWSYRIKKELTYDEVTNPK